MSGEHVRARAGSDGDEPRKQQFMYVLSELIQREDHENDEASMGCSDGAYNACMNRRWQPQRWIFPYSQGVVSSEHPLCPAADLSDSRDEA
jgi:hypothetical protein